MTNPASPNHNLQQLGDFHTFESLRMPWLLNPISASFETGKENGPKTTNDMKLINAGKILENDKTLAESRVAVGELPGGVITMHVIVRPLTSDKASARQPSDPSKNNGCGCTIL
ncbi:hypothetical protein BDL97_04G129000 [Sphagnum fallax]|nr:hypothetical protein BDL97_04G129000 [Sphagnum fallax]